MKTQPKQTQTKTAAELFERGRQIISAPTPAAAPDPVAVPDWVTETHPEHSYYLTLFESDDASVENIEVTRREYVSLKQHLAVMRGIIVPSATCEIHKSESRVASDGTAEPAADRTIDLIAWFADIEEANGGSDTPAESFITGLVIAHHVRSLTPDDAARDLEEFRENFDSMAKAARIFSNRYPEAVEQSDAETK